MSEKTLAEAETALRELEKHKHAVANANVARHKAHARSAEVGAPEKHVEGTPGHAESVALHQAAEEAEAAHAAAVKAEAESGITSRQIDIAAQEVIDLRAAASKGA